MHQKKYGYSFKFQACMLTDVILKQKFTWSPNAEHTIINSIDNTTEKVWQPVCIFNVTYWLKLSIGTQIHKYLHYVKTLTICTYQMLHGFGA